MGFVYLAEEGDENFVSYDMITKRTNYLLLQFAGSNPSIFSIQIKNGESVEDRVLLIDLKDNQIEPKYIDPVIERLLEMSGTTEEEALVKSVPMELTVNCIETNFSLRLYKNNHEKVLTISKD